MKLKEDSENILIKHVPVWKWVVGGILTFIFGVFGFWFIYVVFSNPATPDNWLGLLPLIAFAVATTLIVTFDVNVDSLIFAPLITVSANQSTQNIDIICLRFYGKRVERYYFHQIRKFKSYKGKLNFSSQYFLSLVLVNGKTLKLRIPIGGDKKDTIKFIKRLNKFVRKKVPPKPIVLDKPNGDNPQIG